MNSAYFLCVEALQKIYSLSHLAVGIYIGGLEMYQEFWSLIKAKPTEDELQMLHLGQAQELYWTYHSLPPSEEEYFRMIDGSW